MLKFRMTWKGDTAVPEVYTLAEMEHANEEDADVVEWCRNAKPGDSRWFGGGAFARVRIDAVQGD